jgi:hypothetical protein
LIVISIAVAFMAGTGFATASSASPTPQPGAPQFFSASPGGAMQVTESGGSTAAELTSGPDTDGNFGFGGVNVNFPSGTTFSQLTTLSTMYDMTQGSCGLGAPRFQIDLGDPTTGNYIGTLYAYIGPNASLIGDPCPAADNAWANQANVASATDTDVTRWDASSGGAGGSAYQSWTQVQATYGADQMLDAQIVVDGGYGFPPGYTQQVSIEDWDVNGTIFFTYPHLASGAFVIGDLSASAGVGSSVTFWGAQWSKSNSLSGGSAPSSFEGFADNTVNPPSCNSSWSTSPGNSSKPPSTVPQYMEVIVASAIGKSGPSISGNTAHVVVVQTNPGYADDPGHAGTGTVVAVVC